MATVKITIRPNGPYRVEAPEGSIELVDPHVFRACADPRDLPFSNNFGLVLFHPSFSCFFFAKLALGSS